MLRTIFAIVAILAVPISAHAALELTGIKLLEWCKATQRIDRDPKRVPNTDYQDAAYCGGYMMGYIDALPPSSGACIPIGSTTTEYVMIYINWANAHPQFLHLQARNCVLTALSDAYPCPSTKSSQSNTPTPDYSYLWSEHSPSENPPCKNGAQDCPR